MSTSTRAPSSGRRGGERLPAADPLYLQLQGLLQQGRWEEARTVLDVLARRHAGSEELERYRELLAMRISAEETWGGRRPRPAPPPVRKRPGAFARALRRPAIRALLVANVAVYLLLVLVWLLGARLLWS